jgi:simple sugar transport system permease protein
VTDVAPEATPRRGHTLAGGARLQPIYVPLLAVLVAVVLAALLILAVGKDPLTADWALLRGMYGSGDRVAASLARSTPFIGGALAVAFAFRAGLFNIGVEGQILVGAATAAWVGTFSALAHVPGPLLVPIVLVAGALGGGVWSGIAGLLKARTGAHEVITTIMLNSVAVLGVRWLVGSTDPVVLRDTAASAPQTAPIAAGARLPTIVHSVPALHVGLLVMLGCCAAVWFVLAKTTFGFEVRTVGTNANAARYAGMDVGRTIVLVMVLSGALAGLAGAGDVAGTTGFLSPGVFVSIGFDSIAIALLARANPYVIILTSVLWGSMLSGAGLMQQETGLSIDAVRIFQALVLLLVAADAIVRWLFRIRRPGPVSALDTTALSTGWGEVV